MEQFEENYDSVLGEFLEAEDPLEDEPEAEANNVNEEDTPTTSNVTKTKRIVKNPRPKLNFQVLHGPRGLISLNEMFQDFKYHGNGHEKADLDRILRRLEQWTFRLFPKYHFEDTLKKLEALGKKREVQVYLRKIRMDMLDNDIVRNLDDEDEDADSLRVNEEDYVMKENDTSTHNIEDDFDALLSQQVNSITMAQSMSQPTVQLTDEVKERIEKNRQIALMKRLEKERQATQQSAE